jgi:ATP-dependent Lon protease
MMKRDFEELDDIQQKVQTIPSELPILPVRDAVIFPNAVIPLTVGRESSVKIINDVQQGDGMLVVLTQRDKKIDAPGPTDLYEIGTVSMIHRVMKTPEGNRSSLSWECREPRFRSTRNSTRTFAPASRPLRTKKKTKAVSISRHCAGQ